MTELAEFLKARLDGLEQEARAGTLHTRGCASWRRLWETGPNVTRCGCDCLVVNWLLIDIQAKRQIIALHSHDGPHECPDVEPPYGAVTVFERDCPTLCLLASPFDWHEDYRKDWTVT